MGGRGAGNLLDRAFRFLFSIVASEGPSTANATWTMDTLLTRDSLPLIRAEFAKLCRVLWLSGGWSVGQKTPLDDISNDNEWAPKVQTFSN